MTFLHGTLTLPGDKSISHRALMLGAIARGETHITNLLRAADVRSTLEAMRALGIQIDDFGNKVIVHGQGLHGLKAPKTVIDCGNSGTTMRLLMGLLAGQPFDATLTGDASLSKRPMKRVSVPLSQMGANIMLSDGNFAPLTIHGGQLHPTHYKLPIASAQVKSAIMLAALFCEGTTEITGEIHSRDHSERMFRMFGLDASFHLNNHIAITGGAELKACDLIVPGDPSTAAFWAVAACLVPGSDITLKGVSLNPTRTGFLDVLTRMGANIIREVTNDGPEPAGDLQIKHSALKGTTIEAREIPGLIDEIPILAIAMSQAHGHSVVTGAEELRVKESDRLEAIASNLHAMKVQISLQPDGFKISGPQKLVGADIQTRDDHRIAMAFTVAGLIASGQTSLDNPECVQISYPAFFDTLKRLQI